MVTVRVRLKPSLAPDTVAGASLVEKVAALRETWPVVLLIIGVFGGLFGGLFTPTEAGAVGAMLALVIAAARRRFSLDMVRAAVSETLQSTAAIFIIAVGAQLLTRFLALSGVPEFLAEAVTVEGGGTLSLVLGFSLVYLVLGMFLDPIGIMLLTLPMVLPVAEAARIDLIWLGILLTKYLEIGLITPPVGLNVFVIRTAAQGIATTTIFRGIAWFVVADLFTVALLIAFPEISLLLPRLLR
jgi:tripartite ATP-independent transporter DctM subunit